jgi:hypothetical protein
MENNLRRSARLQSVPNETSSGPSVAQRKSTRLAAKTSADPIVTKSTAASKKQTTGKKQEIVTEPKRRSIRLTAAHDVNSEINELRNQNEKLKSCFANIVGILVDNKKAFTLA